MPSRTLRRWVNLILAGAGAVALFASSASAQDVAWGAKCLATVVPAPCPTLPAPCTPPAEAPPAQPGAPAPAPATAQEPSVDPLAFGATGGGETFAAVSSAVGYIDSALPISQIRLRADAAYDSNRPDRAEFFYAKCGCFNLAGIDRKANGPPLSETRVNYQEVSTYLEWAPVPRFSGFIDVPIRYINPEQNLNASGLSDINLGAKYAVVYSNSQILTTQLRVYTPTGKSDQGLGTDHVSLEPALLLYQRLNDRMSLEAELRDWIPIDGSDFAGNVLRYGVGVNYRVYQNDWLRLLPVAEFVGWTVLNGKEAAFPEGVVFESGGTTIVNAKVGVRAMLGKPVDNGLLSRADIYAGYGRALTGDVWYKDMMRLEFRLRY